jgi:hypothetical protein
MISLRPWLITAHHSVSSLGDPAREASPCSRYLRTARDVDTTCTVRRNVHESLATKVRAHRAPNLLRGCAGRSHADHTEARDLDGSGPDAHVVRSGGDRETRSRGEPLRPNQSGLPFGATRLLRAMAIVYPNRSGPPARRHGRPGPISSPCSPSARRA